MTEQDKFHYSLPEDDGSSRWDMLSAEARQALADASGGPAPAEDLFEKDETAAINPELEQEAMEWAKPELEHALTSWRLYEEHLIHVPKSTSELANGHPRYAETIKRLFLAKQALLSSGELCLDGTNVANDMHLVLVPWEDFNQTLDSTEVFLQRLRGEQGLAKRDDTINDWITNALEDDMPIYRKPAQPEILVASSEYLERSITMDGMWGIMLAQTGYFPGVQSRRQMSPDDLTHGGNIHLIVGDHEVDAMGVFEWLSLSLQERHVRQKTQEKTSWLLANRIPTSSSNPRTLVPSAHWSVQTDGFYINAQNSDHEYEAGAHNPVPRLAVL